jgi:fumarylacetoacetase
MDNTHDHTATCWVSGADGHADFPVQNLPLGVFSRADDPPRIGSAIGDHVVDLAALSDRLDLAADIRHALQQATLNRVFELPTVARRHLRQVLFGVLTDAAGRDLVGPALYRADDCRMELPLAIRDFTDFYAGIHHASAVGALLRPENPLLPNYRYVPVGYHGRASSVRVSGHRIPRPNGQVKPNGATAPVVMPTGRLDYEVELGFWIGGKSELGHPIPIARAGRHIAGVCLLNDWSARDIQAWEYVPLGPFLAKNFATTVSPWVVTAEALEPFRIAQCPRADGDPLPLPYLLDADDQAGGAFAITIEASLLTRRMRDAGEPPFALARTSAAHLYWTPAQMIAHHTVNGCDLAAGDLLGTGTISGPDDGARGSLMELSRGGSAPIRLPNGEMRTFLADGDEVSLSGWAECDGYRRLGFGRCTATIAD